MFDTATERTTAQQKGIDANGIGKRLEQDDAHQAIIPKTVFHFHNQGFKRTRFAYVSDFGFGPSDRREVELIGSLRQLRDTGKLGGGHGRNLDLQLQPGQKIGEGQGLPTPAITLEVLLVIAGSLLIFPGCL